MQGSRVTGMALIFSLASAFTVTTGISGSAQAQSFSCANAQISSELAVCNNESLLIKDEQLASLFADAIIRAVGSEKFEEISSRHSEWLKQRNTCKVDFACLEAKYDARIQELQPTSSSNLSAFASERF